jgi:hypothetical protein
MDFSKYADLPKPRSFKKDLEAKLLNPALTNNFMCHFDIPKILKDYLIDERAFHNKYQQDLLDLSCCGASLPGSTLYTHDVNNIFPGVNEKFAYARAYDDRASFDFYVDNQYYVLRLFEAWERMCVDDNYANRTGRPGLESNDYYMRVRFPDGTTVGAEDGYRRQIIIDKFERDMGSVTAKGNPNNGNQGPKYIRYVFKDAYPIEINSIPVQYGPAELLKVTVSFTYTRFYYESKSGSFGESVQQTQQQNPNGFFVGDSSIVNDIIFNNVSTNLNNQQFDALDTPLF